MTTASRISVFLLAESRLLREALTRILHNRNDMNVVGSAGYSPTVTEAIIAVSPQVLVFDPADIASGLALVRTLRDCSPGLKIVLIGMDLGPENFLRAVREGIAGYALKDATAAEVAAAVRSVINNRAVCPAALCQTLFDYVSRQRADFPSFAVKQQLGLTRREQQLVGLVSRGLTNKEIAVELRLSEQTVKNHIHRMLRKVGVTDRLAAVELCRAQGFLPV
jgi:DNA-binding NarL/FixJ family response regulator